MKNNDPFRSYNKTKIIKSYFQKQGYNQRGSELSNLGSMLPLQPLLILTLAGFQSTEFERSPSL